MTPREAVDIMDKSVGKLTDAQCRILIHYTMGYMNHAIDIKDARKSIFTQVKAATEGKAIPVWP